jgi:hypothetical protein
MDDTATTSMLKKHGFVFFDKQGEANLYHRAQMGFIAVLPDGSWQSSEAGNHSGGGPKSLEHFILVAFSSHMGGPGRYKQPPDIVEDERRMRHLY